MWEKFSTISGHFAQVAIQGWVGRLGLGGVVGMSGHGYGHRYMLIFNRMVRVASRGVVLGGVLVIVTAASRVASRRVSFALYVVMISNIL